MTRLELIKHNLIGDKNFYRRVIAILIPLVIQNTVTNVVSLVDNIMVGSIGTLPMSAVAIVNQLLFVFYLAIFGGYAGAGIFVAQYFGAGDNRGVANCFKMKAYIGTVLLTVAFVIFLVFPDSLVSIYFAKDTNAADAATTLGYAKEYLKIMLVGLPAFALSQIYGSSLREIGETKVPMIASVTAILVNLVFNYILIFGNEGLPFLPFAPLGVAGAAIATVLSRFVEAAIIIIYVHKNNKKYAFINEVFKDFKVGKGLTEEILKKGLPVLINEILWSIGMAAIMQCYSKQGLEVVAATNICSTANNLFNVVFLSMGSAISIIVGQQLGANLIDTAKTTVWRLLSLSVACCTIMGGLMAILAPYIPLMYNTTDTVRQTATELLFVVAAMMPFFAFAHGCYFALRSGGKTIITLIFDCGFTWLVSFPIAFVLATFTSLNIVAIFLCVQLVEVIKCIAGVILIKKGVWINNIVDNIE